MTFSTSSHFAENHFTENHSTVTRLGQFRRRLISSVNASSAPDLLKQHSQALDEYFRDSFQMSHVGPQLHINRNPCAIVALGGYGRQEQCLHSDVDILFVFYKKVPDQAEALIREIIFPLWDLGLVVGHATRAVKECLTLASKDMNVLTALLDSRFICGMSCLYSDLMERLVRKVIRPRAARLTNLLLEETMVRHRVFGDGSCLLEPNLKEGQGGLRDYHVTLWIGRIQHDLRHLKDFEYLGAISHQEHNDLVAALTFIWNGRNRLHGVAARGCDRLYFEYQLRVAQSLQYTASDGLLPVEQFLGDLHRCMGTVKQHHALFTAEWAHGPLNHVTKSPSGFCRGESFQSIGGRVSFVQPARLAANPDLLLQLFETCSERDLPPSAEARRLVREFAGTLGDDFRNNPSVNRRFETLLMTANTHVDILDEMLAGGFLEQFIPEFRRIMHRIEFNAYHLYPVERHAVNTVIMLRRLRCSGNVPGDDLGSRFYNELQERHLLFWAALLHDIGKCQNRVDHAQAGAAIVIPIFEARGFSAEQVATLAFLVEHHRLLYKTATRRDLHDPQTIYACASRIQNRERLKRLYLLTLADGCATGPKAWNDWTAALVQDLVLKVLKILTGNDGATAAPQPCPIPEQADLYADMSARYLHDMTPAQIQMHAGLHERLQTNLFNWHIAVSSDGQRRTLTLCARDRPGLLRQIAGVLALNNMPIFDARVYTWRNFVALDILEVGPPPDLLFETRAWEKVSQELHAALTDKLCIPQAMANKYADIHFKAEFPLEKPVEVTLDNISSEQFTILEVIGPDFPGVLFWISDTLYQAGLHIKVAKIATHGDQVVDVFYLQTADGLKLTDDRAARRMMAAVKEAIAKARGLPGS